MKTRKNIIAALTLCTALSLAACSGKDTAANNTKDTTSVSESTESSKDLNATLDDLYQQENEIFAEHADEWDKVFGAANKADADPSGNYADYLTATVEANKDSFTDEELKTINEDIETIRGIEEQITEIESKLDSTGDSSTDDSSDPTIPFKDFTAKDYDGNDVDDSLFSNNAVTVLNFWFTGCKPCVAELSKLNELNDAIKSMGGEVVGINTETFDGNESAIEEAKSILESQGAKYRNLSIASDSTIGEYASEIMAFPTTILVDRNGNIVGEPFLGGIDNQENYDALMAQIQSVIDADSANK